MKSHESPKGRTGDMVGYIREDGQLGHVLKRTSPKGETFVGRS